MGALKKEENILLPRTDSVTNHHRQHQSNQKNKKLKSRTASRSEQETMLPPTVKHPKREISKKKKNIERIQQQRATGRRGEGESTRGGEEISDLATAPSPALGGEKILGFSRGFRGWGGGGEKEKGGMCEREAREERGDLGVGGLPASGRGCTQHRMDDESTRGERWGPHVSAARGLGGGRAAADVPLTCRGGWWSPRVSLAKAGEKHGGGPWIIYGPD